MSEGLLSELYGLDGRVAVVTGGSGTLGIELVRGLLGAGARVAVLGRSRERLDAAVAKLDARDGTLLALEADVGDERSVAAARDAVIGEWGAVHILVNAAGGNAKEATLSADQTPFDLSVEGFRGVVELNLLGTLIPTMAFGPALAAAAETSDVSIVNVSSMAAQRPLTRVAGYSAAKAAVESFTQWLAVETAQTISPRLRVNAIAPGFLLAEQNRALLYEGGEPTPRAQRILAGTPAQRFGEPSELVSTLLWLCGAGASFVTGTVIPIDGGFGAFSGV